MITKAKMRKILNNTICNAAPGFYSDVYWAGKERITDALSKVCEENDWTWQFEDVWYGHDEINEIKMPIRKTWQITVTDGKIKVSGVIVAAGCGTVDDPLSRYDIVAYF